MGHRDKERLKNDVLDAVIGCKYEAGGGNIQITQIAARVGISTRTLNRYFPDKDEMIYLAAIRFLNSRYAKLSQTYYSSDLSGKNGLERIRFLLEVHAGYYRQNSADAAMVDSANLRYTIGSLEKGYPRIQIGLDIREIFIANMKLGQQDGSISRELDDRNTCAMVAAAYNGLLHRLAYLNSAKCEIIDRETFFKIYNNFIIMVEKYLQP